MTSRDRLWDLAPCGLLATDEDGTVLAANATVRRWTGRSTEDVEGRPLRDLLTAGSRILHETHFLPLVRSRGAVQGLALDLVDADGGTVPVLLTAETAADDDGAPVVHVSLFDARSRAAYEQALRQGRQAAEQAEARLRLLHRVTGELRTADDSSSAVASLVRALASATRGGRVAVWLDDDDGRAVLHTGSPGPLVPPVLGPDDPLPAAQALRTGAPVAVPGPVEAARDWPHVASALAAEGREAVLAAPLRAEGRTVGAYQVLLRRAQPFAPEDLALHSRLGEETGAALHRCAEDLALDGASDSRPDHDALTGAASAGLFRSRLARALASGASPVAVLLLDLDGLRDVNAHVGDAGGDRLLVETAARVAQAAGPSAGTGRLRGGRFAVLAPGVDSEGAARLAAALRDAVRRPVALPRGEVVVTGCVGAVVAGPGATAVDLLREAGVALAEAQAGGRNRQVVHDASWRASSRANAQAVTALLHALDSDADRDGDRITVHYQPVVDLLSGVLVGVEALCRLRRPDGSLQQPGGFIDAAAASGLIVPLGRRVLSRACAQRQEWARQGTSLDLAVNVAAEQAAQEGFADDVLEVLDETGCPPDALVLELTETAVLTATPTTLASLRRLRAGNVRIALDDFGTRYASLDHVRQFPLDELKVDQSFVAGLPHERVARALVRLVVQLAVDLDLTCVAEGVESPEQVAFLRDFGVLGQGYALGRPGPADQLLQPERPVVHPQAVPPGVRLAGPRGGDGRS